MAPSFLQGLQKARFLIVAALVFVFLSSPFMTQAGSKNGTSNVNIISAADTMAGLSGELEIQGKPYQNLEVALTKPDGSQLILQTVTDGQGNANLTLSDYHLRRAGTYEASAREVDQNLAYSPVKTFTVHAGPVSESKSKVTVTKQSASVGETVELTVTLSDNYANPIDGHVLKVVPSSSAASVYSSEFATSEEGQMKFYVSSSKKGIYDFTVFDSSVNKTLSSKVTLAFSGSSLMTDVGGEERVYLSADSGEIDSFIIEGLDEETVVGNAQNVTVKAVDADGSTVLDYTGTIRFASSDDSAALPNDYTFTADDQGEHAFSLAVKFVTPGNQTLSVTDIDEFSITGEAESKVVTSEESGVDYEGDFESTDFEREGDFTLISPASGSYSSDSLEVQGEGEYGYSAIVYMNEEEMAREEIDYDNTFTVTLEDLEDGTYELYVDVVELGDGDAGEEEILEVIESSDSEKIVIDTTAPEIVSISADPEDELNPEETVVLTVLSEKNLEEASIVFEGEVYTLKETSTKGKYQTELPAPKETGDYTVDVLLMDTLGNEVEYHDQLTLTVGKGSEEPSTPEEPNGDTVGIGTVTGLTASNAEETVLLSWETPESENTIAYYRVYYGPSADALYAISETYDASTSWSILELEGEENYYFAVAAVDIEGEEGDRSEIILGVPELAREPVEDTDVIDDTSDTPAITGSEDDIGKTPESGPAQTALLILSGFGALGYLSLRKRAAMKSF